LSTTDIHHPNGTEFTRFLGAAVGEDRNGSAVTVLSTFARLNLDPWEEAANLASLGREAAGQRLGLLLSRFGDVPALRRDHEPVARDLARLLPEGRARSGLPRRAGTKRPPGLSGTTWVALAVVFVLIQVFFAGVPGAGE
jgi:hypothetical protein